MSKFSHFTAVGLLVAVGYALSLGADGRAQVVAMYDVVGEQVSGAIDKTAQFSHDMADASTHVSLASIYSAIGVFAGIVPESPAAAPAAVSEGVVVIDKANASVDQVRQIKANFSDTVKVKPDASKKSGTITPVFKGVSGQSYTYVIVPVKK